MLARLQPQLGRLLLLPGEQRSASIHTVTDGRREPADTHDPVALVPPIVVCDE